jgi:putative membrane protein
MMLLRSTKEAVMFNGFHSMGAGGWVLMALFWVALVALVVWAVVRLFPSRTDGAGEPRGRSEEPREILDRRLASGEIDVETYERLRSRVGPPSLAGRG